MVKCRYCNKEVNKGKYVHELYCIKNPNHRTAADVNIKDVWNFWNNCFLGRTRAYQPRKLKLEDSVRLTGTTCPRCGKMVSSLVYIDDIGMGCRSCKVEIETDKLQGARREIRIKNLELAEKFHNLLGECTKKGTCDILAAHHELLQDDDDRLRTSVLLDLVCKNEYEDKWNEILDKANAKIESERLEIKNRTGASGAN